MVSPQTLKISDNCADFFKAMFDKVSHQKTYITYQDFQEALFTQTGRDILFFCQLLGRPLFYLFEQVDIDQDGKISWEEFVKLLTTPLVKI